MNLLDESQQVALAIRKTPDGAENEKFRMKVKNSDFIKNR